MKAEPIFTGSLVQARSCKVSGIDRIQRVIDRLSSPRPNAQDERGALVQDLQFVKSQITKLVEIVECRNKAIREEAESVGGASRNSREASWNRRFSELLDDLSPNTKVWLIKENEEDGKRYLSRINRGFTIVELLGISNLINITLSAVLDKNYEQHIHEVRTFAIALEQPNEKQEKTNGQE